MVDLNPIKVDPVAMRTGLAWAQSWTKGHILCKLGEGALTFMVADADGFLAVWSWPAPEYNRSLFFLIPPFVAKTLSGRAAWELEDMRVLINRNAVGMIFHAQREEFRLQWKWHAKDFRSPAHFRKMSRQPDMMVRAPYVNLADVIHLAIANMINPALVEDIPPDQPQGGILIDFMPGQINIDGEMLSQQSQQARYYFNPKMLMRGLEIVREAHLGFTIQEIIPGRQAALYLACEREGWSIHTAIHSVGVSHSSQQPTMRIRETRPPMQDGSWLRGARTEND